MAKVKSVRHCRTAKQFRRSVQSQGGWAEQGSKHERLHHPDGGWAGMSRGSGEIGFYGLVKALLMLGFVALPFICTIVTLLQVVEESGF